LKEKEKEKEMETLKCTICGKEHQVEIPENHQFNFRPGFGSRFDMVDFKGNICDDCIQIVFLDGCKQGETIYSCDDFVKIDISDTDIDKEVEGDIFRIQTIGVQNVIVYGAEGWGRERYFPVDKIIGPAERPYKWH